MPRIPRPPSRSCTPWTKATRAVLCPGQPASMQERLVSQRRQPLADRANQAWPAGLAPIAFADNEYKIGGATVSADVDQGTSPPVSRAPVSVGVLTAAGAAALVTGALIVWLAAALNISGLAWLPWLVLALSPAAAGGFCLARRRHWRDALGPAAVLGSCVAAIGTCVPVGSMQNGTVVTVI